MRDNIPTSAEKGYCYVMHSPAMPDLYKIGVTIHHPLDRAQQLSASTSAALPFSLVYYRRVEYPYMVESTLHRRFEADRVNDKREFFLTPLREIIAALETFEALPEARLRVEADDMELPWSELFWSFPGADQARELTPYEQELCRALERRIQKKTLSENPR